MTPIRTQQLFKRFTWLYRGCHLPATENLMCYGFQCGDSWFDLIWQLSKQIEGYCQQHPIATDLMAVQIKQKFGELRFYTRHELPEVEYLIEEAWGHP